MKRFLPILCLILLAACGERREVRRLMAEADSLVTACPDSALAMLERIDTAGLRRAERMHLELMRGKAITRAGNTITTDSVARKVAAYYDRWPHRDPNRRMLAHYYLGMAYRDMGSAIRALEEFQTAASVADTASAQCDLPTLMRVHSQMETIFMNQRLYDLQREENKIAEALCWKIGDTLSALIFEDHKCNMLYLDGLYSECIASTEKVYRRFLSAGFPENAALVCFCIVKSAEMLRDYPTMKKYLDIYETSSYLKENLREVCGGIAPLYNYKGLYYLGVQELDSAEYYFRQAISNRGSFRDNEWSAYDGLRRLYEQRLQLDSALKYSCIYAETIYLDYNRDNGKTMLQMKSIYDYSVEQKIAKEKTQENAQLKMGLLVAGIMLLICYTGFRLTDEKKKRRISELKYSILDATEKLRQAESHLFSSEVHAEDNCVQDVETEEVIREMEDTIIRLTDELDRLQRHSANRKLSNSEIVARINKVASSVTRESLTATDWDRLKMAVEEECPSFYKSMNQRISLSVIEYRVCLLVKTGFSPSQIEILMGMNPKYASTVRRRLHMKVFGVAGSSFEFDKKVRAIC